MAEKRDSLLECIGFDWDEGNIDKNWQRHRVAFWECEEIYFNRPLVVQPDTQHSAGEGRYFALGQTDGGRFLFVAFTIRNRLIRPISFRDMTAKERRVYEFRGKKDSEV